MTYVGKDGSIFGVSQELDIDLSNYYTKAQAERRKYSITKNIDMKNAYKLKNYPSPTGANDLVRLSDLTQYISLNKTAVYFKDTEVLILSPGHTEFTVPIKINFYKEGRIVYMRIINWGYDMNDLGYNWSFKIDLKDLEQLNQSRKEEYYPLGIENEFCGSTISKQQIKEFNKGKYNSGFALVYIMKTEKTGLYIISKEIQNDLTMGRWGGVSCHNIILSYISNT